MAEPFKYDLARRALAEAKTLDEVAAIADRTQRMREYARRINDRQLEIDVAELKIRAERRRGQVVSGIKASTGLSAGTRGQLKGRTASGGPVKEPPEDARPTLASLGMDKKLSMRSQRLASMSEETFEEAVGRWRQKTVAGEVRLTPNLLAVVQREENRRVVEASKPVPAGRYATIVVDAPWPIKKSLRLERPDQVEMDYATLSVEEIGAFDVPALAADDGFVFCWAPQRFLEEAFAIVRGWGFRPAFTMVWHKSGGNQPFGLPQFNCEFVVVGRRGDARFRDLTLFNCCFDGVRRGHSRKPVEFYETVARVTDGPRIDVFGREAREGFTVWGAEGPADERRHA